MSHSDSGQNRPAQAPTGRPDTSKNGLMKKNQLGLRDESVKSRGRSILARLDKKTEDPRPEGE
ncbi:hypothetical protein [Brevibacillus dissolubilis]|uniref:hypothetical protein n=1 Tax=Brevibacillus dissolubilis TaxID=1844116 RepID=UPI001115EC19|nr:hypothetical protein [Brevibacillus dissolubilis]